MTDLLIVRMANRSKERYSRKARAENVPVGMHFGLVVGVGLGLGIASASEFDPFVGIAIGAACGIVFGVLLGRFLKPTRRYRRTRQAYSYEGMPLENEEGDESGESSPKTSQ